MFSVLATEFSNLIQVQKANPSGVDAILSKPIAINTFAQTVHQLLVKQLNPTAILNVVTII
ncbi:MAG: hypothetical protein GY699_00735 [Desulfobacteraceae bacterium]|nr:hypothetical protein [Desulfobacteraceae bacterium]